MLAGQVVLIDENGDHDLAEGDFAAFPAGSPNGHCLENRSDAPVRLLVVGSRRPRQDVIHYSDDPLGPFRR